MPSLVQRLIDALRRRKRLWLRRRRGVIVYGTPTLRELAIDQLRRLVGLRTYAWRPCAIAPRWSLLGPIGPGGFGAGYARRTRS